MTPKEKASELIVNYQLQCKSLDYQQAKQCALIASDEIIDTMLNELLRSINIHPSASKDVIERKLEFWTEVLQEIEKL